MHKCLKKMTEHLAHGTYLMNTNMTGIRWFPYFVCLRVHWAQIAPASEDLTPSHLERTDCLALQYAEKDWTKENFIMLGVAIILF